MFGEDGLISNAERANIEHTHATVWEAMEMEYSNYWIDKVMLGGDLITYLQGEDKEIIGKELYGAGYVINVDKLLGNRMSLGNGTDGENDVYKLEEVVSGTKYSVKYYGPSGDRELGILGDSITNLIESDNPNFEIKKEVTSKSIKGGYYTVGDTIEYTITAKNTGDVPIKDIKITDELTAGSGTYKPGSDKLVLSKEKSSEKVGVGDGYWTISSLESQETATICYTYTVQQKDIEAGKVVVNVITELTGEPQPTVPRGHKIPKEEVPTVPEEDRTFFIRKVDTDGNLLPGAVIEIYTDKSCSQDSFYETIDLQETPNYDHSYNIPPVGKYYIKETKVPEGYNKMGIQEFAITGKQHEEWTIVNFGGTELPETVGTSFAVWTDSNGWRAGIAREDLSVEDLVKFEQPSTIHIYRLGSVDDNGYITYADSINNIDGLPCELSEDLLINNSLFDYYFLNDICKQKGVESIKDLNLELYLDYNLVEDAGNIVYPENGLIGTTDIFVACLDNIVTNRFIYRTMPKIMIVTKNQISEYSLEAFKEERLGNIEISSTMEGLTEGEVETIIYQIDEYIEDELVDSKIEKLIFRESGEQTIKLEFPLDSQVIISQVYAGKSCCVSNENKVEEVYITEEEIQNPARVSFENQYIESEMKYGIIQNQFTYTKDGWKSNQENIMINNNDFSIKVDFIENEWMENIMVTYNANGEPMYVRARAYGPGYIERLYSGDNWTPSSSNFYYYDYFLESGDSTSEFNVRIEGIPEDSREGDQFEVIFVYEAVPVIYDGDNPLPPEECWIIITGG